MTLKCYKIAVIKKEKLKLVNPKNNERTGAGKEKPYGYS
jgi:hypothetical protein